MQQEIDKESHQIAIIFFSELINWKKEVVVLYYNSIKFDFNINQAIFLFFVLSN